MGNWIGAKWWKMDFHLHTPASFDYGKGPNQEALKGVSAQEYLLNLMEAELDCVVISDHNSGAWIDILKDCYDQMKANPPEGFRELFIFPGVEITVNGGIHVLAIFDLDKSTSDIDTLLGALTYRGEKGSSDNCTEKSITEVIKIISSYGAIPIPAHIDDTKGLFRELSGTSLEQVLCLNEVYAMEIKDLSYAPPELYRSTKANWTKVFGTDSHHLEGTDGEMFPGEKYTWVKMDTPSLDGLKLSLLDGEISIKPTTDNMLNPNALPNTFIGQMTINKAKYIGRATPFLHSFNPWLNTIIGGRGTGKSSLIEFIRTVTDRIGELPSSLESDYRKYSRINSDRNDDGLLTSNTEFQIEYFKNNTQYSIKYFGNEYTISEMRDGTFIESVGDVNQRFPVRIYSQKQIFEMAKDQSALLKILDEAEGINYNEWEREYNALTASFMTNSAKIRELKEALVDENRVLGEIEDLNKKIEIIERLGHAEVLNNFQNSMKKRQKDDDEFNEIVKSFEILCEAVSNTIHQITESDEYLVNEEAEKDFNELNGIYTTRLDEIKASMTQNINDYGTVLDKWKQEREKSELSNIISDNKAKYEELNNSLTEAGIENITNLNTVFESKKEKVKRLDMISKVKDRIGELENNAASILETVKEKRAELTNKRQELLGVILEGNEYVKINVIPYGSTKNIVKDIRNILNKESGYDRDISEPGIGDGILSTFAEGENNSTKADLMKNKLIRLYNGEEVEVNDARFKNHIRSLGSESIERLRCWLPEDSLKIEYSLRDGDAFRPINQGSPGQKTAALLAFILSYGDEPLILDQPEDDLDNHLIYNLIVTQLRNVKQSRQVIIVTHNANIVVNGDSENVTCLDIVRGQSSIVAQGSLQDGEIRKWICNIMEGGETAFDKRYERIRLRK